ncbi:hypothetical protein [Antrihabitans sp. YC2-6]|uniref:Rv0361 family membrane protein n=1 Tax=Antrihabitans sp. YC2-6 TaxID=2799498 RepID=UPI0018F6C824|nr:hypothetical protein [Antrihabitans sp. YC2-6]MBJ8348986.1 hypothetical protein [Antrihabitans sp. YC2-6]
MPEAKDNNTPAEPPATAPFDAIAESDADDADAVTEAIPTVTNTPDQDEIDTKKSYVVPPAEAPPEPPVVRRPPKLPPPRRIPTTHETPAAGDTAVNRPRPSQPPQPPHVQAEPPRTPPPPIAKPLRVPAAEPLPPRKSSKGWLAALLAVLVLIALVVGVVALLGKTKDEPVTPESQIRDSIATFSRALSDGDIQTLRKSTCGPLAEYYGTFSDEKYEDIYKSVERDDIPVVSKVEQIQITDRTAIAEVTAYTRADTGKQLTRTINLENTDDGWKVCYPPQ